MRRLLSSILLATVAGALAIGAAASMPVSSANLGSGGADVTACDEDGVTIGYELDAGDPSVVTGLVIEDVAATCAGQTVSVAVSNEDGDTIAEISDTLSGAATQSLALAAGEDEDAVAASDVHGVSVTIAGTSTAAADGAETTTP